MFQVDTLSWILEALHLIQRLGLELKPAVSHRSHIEMVAFMFQPLSLCVLEEKGLHVLGGGDQQEVRNDLLHLLPERGGGSFGPGPAALWGRFLHKLLTRTVHSGLFMSLNTQWRFVTLLYNNRIQNDRHNKLMNWSDWLTSNTTSKSFFFIILLISTSVYCVIWSEYTVLCFSECL